MVQTEIKINNARLIQAQVQMANLAQSVQAYRVNASLGKSEGDVAEELMNIGASLQAFAEAFGALASQCAAALRTASGKVDEMETLSSSLFDLKG